MIKIIKYVIMINMTKYACESTVIKIKGKIEIFIKK